MAEFESRQLTGICD